MPFFIISFLILTVVSILYYKYAIKTNIIDNPNHRSSHKKPTVRGGGILFFFAILLFFLYFKITTYTYFLVGFILLSIMGFIDDKKELSAKIRFPFQLVAVFLILFDAGFFQNEIPLYINIVAFIIGVGFINAFNFMDGINSITGFYTTAIIIPLLYINEITPFLNANFFYVILTSIIIFGFYNFRKNALMFAGDVGSMALATTILFWIAKAILINNSPILILLGVIYGLDSALTIIYRIYLKENISEGHRKHLYQKFVDILNWTHLKVALLYGTLQLATSFGIIKYYQKNITKQLYMLFFTLIIGIFIYVLLQYYFNKKVKKL